VRIAYVTPYQGPTVVTRRPIVRNRSISNKIKIELIAGLLHASSHEVEIISHGEVIERQFKFYPGFYEPELFHSTIPIYYVSSLPIKRLNGFWSGRQALRFFKRRHRVRPYDLLIIFNMKPPQIVCANYAIRRLGLPVILEYEDDAFASVVGETNDGLLSGYHRSAYRRILDRLSGCMAVSPHLLFQVPSGVPKLLLRGVVGDDIVEISDHTKRAKENWILFSGTHIKSNGVSELIAGWKEAALSGWQLHITGFGAMTEQLREMAENDPSITFHGLVSRQEFVRLICSAKICINPHAVSQTPGNVFAFKIIEYLAAGAHVITTPMGTLEREIERGITYLSDNAPESIASALRSVTLNGRWHEGAADYVQRTYGTAALSKSLDLLIRQATNKTELAVNGLEIASGLSRPEPPNKFHEGQRS
jgi:glycosyltransferase involved in cell wall biosynthesis